MPRGGANPGPVRIAGTRRPRKWRLLAAYWLVQSVVMYALFPGLMAPGSGALIDDLLDPTWMVIGLTWVVLVTVGQAAFALPVRPPRTGSSRVGGWVRHVIAGVALGTIAALVCPLAVASVAFAFGVEEASSGTMWPWVFGATGVVCSVMATAMLRVRYADRTPIGVSVAIAGAVSAALLLGAAFAIMEGIEQVTRSDLLDGAWHWPILGSIAVGWVVGTPLIWAFIRRGPREGQLARLASRLFLGTVIETVAVIPLDVMVRRKTDCYCGEGTFWSLVLCGSAGFLMLGPGVFFLVGRRRRRWLAGRCEVCEYDMSGCMDAERCPECGAGWRAS
jgi:hypothetical protein